MKLLAKFALLLFLGLVVWDIHRSGLKDSVAAYAFVALAERATEASEKLPGLMQSGLAVLRQFMEEPAAAPNGWLTPLPAEAARSVADLDSETTWAMRLASARTGVSLAYLVNTARLEANFNAQAKSRTSSAAGLYQIIEGTWLWLMSKFGAQYGWSGYVGEITCADDGGRCETKSEDSRKAILDLRFDGMTATFLAAEFARTNRAYLEKALGEPASDFELYLAHLLGARGAVEFAGALEASPEKKAAALFPAAARANWPLFYNRQGAALSFQAFEANLEDRWQASIRALNAETADGKAKALSQDLAPPPPADAG